MLRIFSKEKLFLLDLTSHAYEKECERKLKLPKPMVVDYPNQPFPHCSYVRILLDIQDF